MVLDGVDVEKNKLDRKSLRIGNGLGSVPNFEVIHNIIEHPSYSILFHSSQLNFLWQY